ncbi:winged helix-turn-helix domain-containing protein [Aliivibrio fischeri]
MFLLYSNPNKIYTKDEIYTQCWEDGSVANSVVTQTISLLRKNS